MARGSRTSAQKEEEFRKHYLVTGNVCGSAKAVGLTPSTGYELRARALKDKRFVKARESIREKLEPEAEQMAMCAMQLCMERLNVDAIELVQKLAAATKPKRGSKTTQQQTRIQIQDPGPQYAASFAKLYQALMSAKRFEAERKGEVEPIGSVTIKVSGPASAKLGDDGT